jgi:hypothetical protein
MENDAVCELGSSGPIFKGQWTTDTVYKHWQCTTIDGAQYQRRINCAA